MIIHQPSQKVIADKVAVADRSWPRMKGLLGRKALDPGEALVLIPCNSIHMLFMAFPIDVIFLDERKAVVGLVTNIPPFCFSPIFWKAKCAIELPAGTLQKYPIALGDIVTI